MAVEDVYLTAINLHSMTTDLCTTSTHKGHRIQLRLWPQGGFVGSSRVWSSGSLFESVGDGDDEDDMSFGVDD